MRAASRAASRVKAALAHRRLPLWLALLSGVLLLPVLGAGFQLDDHFQRFRLLGHGAPSIQLFVFFDGEPESTRAMMEAGVLPWWTASDLRHASLRYLSVLTMQLDYLLWPDHAEWMHLHSLLWLCALVASAVLLYRRIMGATWAAGLAALLYAVDDAHALPTAYLANRNALIATCLGVLALLCFVRGREGSRWAAWLGPALLALALAAGEMALAVPGYLLAYALFLDRGSPRERIRALLPAGGVLLAFAVVFRLGRFGSHGSGFYVDPLGEPLAFALALAERAPILLLGQWSPIPSDLALADLPGDRSLLGLRLGAVGVVALLGALLFRLVSRDRVARFWCVGALLSLLPVAAVGPQDRLLFFVGLGSMGLLAQFVLALVSGAPAAPRSRAGRLVSWTAALVLLGFHLLLAPASARFYLGLQEQASAAMLRAIDRVPGDARIAGQDLVLLNPPDHVYLVTAIPFVKALAGQPAPRRLRALSAGSSAQRVARLDAHTLRVELDEGMFPAPFSRYFRSEADGFQPGQRVELGDLSVEIERVNRAGDPDVVRYRFATPLEDPSLRWLAWRDGVYVPWSPPAIGASVSLPPSRGIFSQ